MIPAADGGDDGPADGDSESDGGEPDDLVRSADEEEGAAEGDDGDFTVGHPVSRKVVPGFDQPVDAGVHDLGQDEDGEEEGQHDEGDRGVARQVDGLEEVKQAVAQAEGAGDAEEAFDDLHGFLHRSEGNM